MKALISKLIHIVIMPCSHVPLQIECERAGSLSPFGVQMVCCLCEESGTDRPSTYKKDFG